jgi:hypothetical protein
MKPIRKFVVITTIHPPSRAVELFAQWPGWHVIVVGDRKTPADWHCEGVTYLGLEEQYERFGPLARAIPENTYTRKMLGYAEALSRGAEAIFESDDDNLPLAHAAGSIDQLLAESDGLEGEALQADGGWVNIYEHFGAPRCWPRGFPLEALRAPLPRKCESREPWKVMQFLANDDPDVDAVYRMVRGSAVHFARGRTFRLARGTYCPMNSQATLWLPEAFPLMFLPLGVPDRVTDILRGYTTLACLWQLEYTLAYSSPVVYQDRNAHNLLRDFADEVPLYLNADKWSKLLLEAVRKGGQAPYILGEQARHHTTSGSQSPFPDSLSSPGGTTAAECFHAALERLVAADAIPRGNLAAYATFLEAARLSHRQPLRSAA